ncbi:glycosyltransferase family 4 protein [Arthrobacter sp. P2b]|uniref:glycosyltransferase family 4 protein n=1 Tax=Arthrobacter sp. P2b TaxID=1938741 RepID=UPI0009CAE0EA|nr:glycosyltransferase family 4 protein [Arthrobacter sp. P2b]SLK16858.1 Glycosyltransferase involved in cell wall bisynthesis [Arthrobacter sp. P2b]
MASKYGKIIHFLLPGYTDVPFGGYKIVYEYANYLAQDPQNKVFIHQTKAFFGAAGLPKKKWILLRSFKAVLKSVRATRAKGPIPWFVLDDKIVVKNRVRLPQISSEPNTVLIATSVQTAPFVDRFIRDNPRAAGVYFLQSFEDWAAPKAFVEATWKMPLHRVVIAPWLQQIGNRLGVTTHLVPNAVDPKRFPRGPELASRPKLVAGLVSTLPLKRTDLLAEVFRELKQADPDIQFVTFGTCPRPDVLPDFVEHFESPSADKLVSIYQSAQVYMCVSDLEGWALPPAEALLSGAALVSTDIGGVRAYASESALFSPPGDKSSLVKNVLEILNNIGQAQVLANRGYDLLVENSPETAARRFANQLDAALRERVNL